jgi:ribosomal protein S18 acetylase RimI-like enzyme
MNEHTEMIKVTPHDLQLFKELLVVFGDVFEMKNFQIPDDTYLQQVLESSSFMVYVVRNHGKTVGGLTAYILPSYYFKSSEVYIYDLAIMKQFQRKGLGRKLMSVLKDDCKALGFKEVFVQADLVDSHALEFYRSIGGTAESVVHFYYPLYA